ncbi:MAG: hypothetical protein RL358_78 [Pseudomonadota bacterium]|jgi:HD-like signal output (HDOD) protein
MNLTDSHQLLSKIIAAIDTDAAIVPTLPDYARELQALMDDPNVSAEKVVMVLSGDPAICAQIIKLANSALFADKGSVYTLRDAIARLGYRQLRNLVMSLSIAPMMHAKNPLIAQRMQQLWTESREISAICTVIARRQPQLSADQAGLAGLLHRIGVIPLCLYLDEYQPHIEPATLERLILKYAALISVRLLHKWNFPAEISAAVSEYQDIHRDSALHGLADYADVITFASLQVNNNAKVVDWQQVKAAQRLAFQEDECRAFSDTHQAAIAAIAELLGNKAQAPVARSPAVARAVLPALRPVQHNNFWYLFTRWWR